MARIAYTVVSLRFFGDDLDPQELSTRLASLPTKAASKGEVTASPTGTRVAKTGNWRLTVEAHTAAGDLNTLITRLFERLTPNLEIWRDISSRFRGDLSVGLFLGTSNEGAFIAPATISDIAARGLGFNLDIYDKGAREA